MKVDLTVSCRVIAFCTAMIAVNSRAEVRKWTDVEGRTLEAELVSQTASEVQLRLAGGQLATVAKLRLSSADRSFLESASASQAPRGVPQEVRADVKAPAFFQVQLDPKQWKVTSKPEAMGITGYDFDEMLESPHFLVFGGKKVKESHLLAYAEAGERLVSHIGYDMPGFLKSMDGRRMTLWLAPTKEEHVLVGKALEAIGSPSLEWEESSIAGLSLNDDVTEKNKLLESGRGFVTDYESTSQGNVRWTKRIHFLTGSLVGFYLPDYGQDAASMRMMELCYSYYLERMIGGKIESKVKYSGEMDVVEGFKNGRDWEGAVKRLLAKSPVKPSIEKFTTQEPGDAEPIDVAFGYGLVKFIFTNAERKAAFNDLVEKCRTERRSPAGVDYANIFRATSVEDFDRIWLEYLKSPEF